MTDATSADPNLDELRVLITGPVTAELEALRARVTLLEGQLLEANQRADAVGEVLVEAAKRRRMTNPDADGEFSDAIRPEVELAIHRSARTDVDVMADALYPVLGPAIRKMITSLFTQGDAKPFRVERVILMHRVTALPLVEHSAPGVAESDSDVISGMLDAIRSFVEDAFEAPQSDGLNELRVGDIDVLVEWGPLAVLAVVCRGVVPGDFRLEARELLERLHGSHGAELARFSGDDSAFALLKSELVTLEHASTDRGRTHKIPRAVVALGVVLLVVALIVLVAVVV